MPWETIQLNDGNAIPTVAYGTSGQGNGRPAIDYIKDALDTGFVHIDTAQLYRNEVETGKALRESNLPRDKIFVTTKYSGMDSLDIETSIHNSLKNLGISYVDLYLIHSPRVAKPSIAEAWAKMEDIKARGLARSIGVSNFDADDLAELLKTAKVTPAANQIYFHPYVFVQQQPILSFCAEHNIVVEGFSPLTPITEQPGGPVTAVIGAIAEREKVTPDMVLLAWAKSKGIVVVTASSKKYRMEGYIAAGDLALTTADLTAIDAAGAAARIEHCAPSLPLLAGPPAYAGLVAAEVDDEKAPFLADSARDVEAGEPMSPEAFVAARRARTWRIVRCCAALLVLGALVEMALLDAKCDMS